MTHSTHEHRLIHAIRASKPTRQVTGYDEFGKPIVKTATQAAADQQSAARQDSLQKKNDTVVTVQGGLKDSQYSGRDSEQLRDANGDLVNLNGAPVTVPKGSTVTTRQISQPLNYQPPAQPTAGSPAPVPAPQPSPPKGVIEETRDLRQQGFDTKVDGTGEVTVTGSGGPVATPQQVADNAQNLKGIMNARPLSDLARSDQVATLDDLRGAGLNSVGDVIGRGVEEVDGAAYVINADGTRTRLPSDWKEQFQADAQRVAQEQAAADAAIKAQEKQFGDNLTRTPDGGVVTGAQPPPVPPNRQLQNTIDSSAAKMLVASLPPGYEFLGPAYAEALGSFAASSQGQDAALLSSTAIADDVLAGKMSITDAIEARYREQSASVRPLLDKVVRDKQQALADERAAAENYIEWQKQKDIRKKKREKTDSVEKAYADLAIAGGFGSSNGLGDIREHEAMLEQAIDDAAREWGFKKIDVGIQITQQYNAATEQYVTALVKSEERLADKLAENDSRKLGAVGDQGDDYQDAIKNHANEVQSARQNHTSTLRGLATDVSNLVADERSAKAKQDSELWDRAMKYVDTYGTQNPVVLSAYESALGLAPGALSNQRTLEELRMRKSGAGGVATGSAPSLVDEERKRVRQAYPDAAPSVIDTIVYGTLSAQFGSDEKGKSVLRQAYDYMSTNPLDGGAYRIQPFLTSSQASGAVDQALQQAEDGRAIAAEELTAEDLYAELTDSNLPAGQRMSPGEAEAYIQDLGYARVPKWYLPRSAEPFTKAAK